VRSILELSLDGISEFLELKEIMHLKRASPASLINLMAFIHIFIFDSVKSSQHPVIPQLTRGIAEISVAGKDECCREITACLARSFSVEEFRLFDGGSLKSLISSGMRSLIRLIPETQSENVMLLSKVIQAAPPDVIISEQTKLIAMLTRAVEFQPIDDLLDTIAAITRANRNIEQFNNMSQISVPRLLTLSVSENESTRAKATAVLRSISGASPDESIIAGLVREIGIQEVASLALFFLDWAAKGSISELSLRLLKDFAATLRADARLKAEFTAKITPVIKALMSNSQQLIAVDLISVLLA
jgi:hypothetical protein